MLTRRSDKETSMRRGRGIYSGIFALWRLRLLTGVLLSLPFLLLTGWYAGNALISHAILRNSAGGDLALTPALYRLYLYDKIRTDVRRLSMPDAPEKPSLPVVSLRFTRFDLQTLNSGLAEDALRPYVPVFLADGKGFLPGTARVRGGRPWHWAHAQKSLKIVMDPGFTFDGASTFNLLNEVEPIGVGETVVLDVLKDLGVLTPQNRLVRVEVNNRPMGVYLFITQVNEGLLRKNRRIYGSLYSGNEAPTDPATGRSRLWFDAKPWKKVAFWRKEEEKDKSELENLLRHVGNATAGEFVSFARDRIDLERFASFDAVDVVFGGNQHDWDENHKIFFDPYKGRFEPVAWNFRGWRHEPAFLTVENPLRIRLAQVPGYLVERNRVVYELLTGPCSIPAIRASLLGEIRDAAPEYAGDPHWDAYKLLPPVSGALRRMVRPMNEQRQALVLESEIKTFSQRHAYLLGLLERDGLDVRVGPVKVDVAPIDVVVDGYGAYRLERLDWEGPAEPERPGWTLFRDSNLNGRFDPEEDEKLLESPSGRGGAVEGGRVLEPACRLVARSRKGRTLGHVAVEPVPRRYRFFLVFTGGSAGPGILRGELAFRNVVTGWRLSRTVTASGPPPRIEDCAPAGSPDEVPPFEPGAVSVHPWKLVVPRAGSVLLGPGPVEIEASRVFAEGATVKIEAGTTLELGPGVSLVFRGRLEARGTGRSPIVVRRRDPGAPFGGIALQGPATRGSVLEHLHVEGGSSPSWGRVRFPGMVNVHDTRGVRMYGLRLGGNEESDDILHLAYCKDVVLERCCFFRPNADALDMEFCKATLRSCHFLFPPDECLDLMGTTVTLSDCVLLGPRNNAVSSGERSKLRIHGCLIAGARAGILVKSRSEAHLVGNLFFRNDWAVRLITKSPKYGGRSKLSGEILYAVECPKTVFVDDGSSPDVTRVVRRFPRDGSLDHLLHDVLGLDHWRFLADWFEKQEGGKKWR